MTQPWYADHYNIYALAEWLVSNDKLEKDFDKLLLLIERPQRWTEEWQEYQAECAIVTNAVS